MGPGKAPGRTSTLRTRVTGCGVRQPWGAPRACLQQGPWPWRRTPSRPPRAPLLTSCCGAVTPARSQRLPPPGRHEAPSATASSRAQLGDSPRGVSRLRLPLGEDKDPLAGDGGAESRPGEAGRSPSQKRQGRRGAVAVRTSAQPRPRLPGEHQPRAEPPAAQTPRRPCGGRAAAQACGGRSVRTQRHVRR